MSKTPLDFEKGAHEALGSPTLQQALGKFQTGYPLLRARAMQSLPDFEKVRTKAARIKDFSLKNLEQLTNQYREKVEATGGTVHICETTEDARKTVVEICRQAEAKKITKSKSMVTEELALNDALEAAGMEVLETDLGEYIVQLAGERPSHIVGPALHKTKEEVAQLFKAHHKTRRKRETGEQLVREAREVLREQYFASEVGITGANFLIAETGTAVIVTNEGNADLCRILPNTHIVVTSMEKVIPTLDDLSVFLRLLARSALGQEMTSYTTLVSGPRGPGESEGPSSFHVVIVDGGRSKLLGTEQEALLRCIKCGACMNVCPVYMSVGGHTYGWVYPGPIGAVLNPVLNGFGTMYHNYQASTFCGACEEVCPVKIPLTKIMRDWRTRAFQERIPGLGARLALWLWAAIAANPSLYNLAAGAGIPILRALAGKKGVLKSLPFANGWMKDRVLDAPEGGRFVRGRKR